MMNRLFAWILAAVLCVGLTACGTGTSKETPATDAADTAMTAAVEQAYQDKIAELEAVSGEALAWVQIKCGTGEKILVVTSSVYGDGETMEADIFQYADGEVKRIGSVSSTGTAYPLAFTEEAVLFGGNHTAGKLVIQEGTGELYRLTNLNIEGRTPVLEVYAVEDGEETLKSSEEIPTSEADSYDYYINAFAEEKAEIIMFQ